MKRIFFASISLALLFNLKVLAQLPNPGFETWQPIAAYERPVGWETSDTAMVGGGFSPNVNKETVDFHGGAAAVKLETGVGLTIAGVIVSGKIKQAGLSLAYSGGFPWVTRSQKLSGFYKYTAGGGGVDSCLVTVILFKRNGANRDTIAFGKKVLGTQTAYVQFDDNLVYKDFSTNPDSALIIIQSSKNLYPGLAGTILLVDDLGFVGTVPAGINIISKTNTIISVYPNPATEFVNFSISNISNAKSLTIYDILGKKVKSIEITSTQLSVSTEGLNNSLYFYQVADRNNNIISTGKFSVKK